MRFDCGPTYAEKFEAKKQWHRVFLWWPVRVGARECRWLEWIERKGEFVVEPYDFPRWDWTYRTLTDAH
jgi:hypothetical protein